MFHRRREILALGLLTAIAGCRPPAAPSDPLLAAGYSAPPAAVLAQRTDHGVTLSGTAKPGAQVRLAEPAGPARIATADRRGRWRLTVAAEKPSIFGLSMVSGGRRTQAQGYLLVMPDGQAALLRAGSGARRLDLMPDGVGAFDVDALGAAVVSGRAPADTPLSVRVDGRHAVDGRSDAEGRFAVLLPALLRGVRRIEVAGEGFRNELKVEVAPPAPLVEGPLRSQLSSSGVRADWLTPGGGVQSTLIAG